MLRRWARLFAGRLCADRAWLRAGLSLPHPCDAWRISAPDKSQAVIGIQMACAYVGTSLMPPLFGLIAAHITVSLLPAYLLALLALMTVMHERLLRRTAH